MLKVLMLAVAFVVSLSFGAACLLAAEVFGVASYLAVLTMLINRFGLNVRVQGKFQFVSDSKHLFGNRLM